jgi:hypothetical protein
MNHKLPVILPTTTETVVDLLLAMAETMSADVSRYRHKHPDVSKDHPTLQDKLDAVQSLRSLAHELKQRKQERWFNYREAIRKEKDGSAG